jgi:cysteinyl-tRNA synthetase
MEWESPWGKGFPGWHIECTAMSTKFLGNPFDIHTGGEDHINIHHTNEIAQGYGAFGAQTANVWMHNAFITFNGAKISKSTGGLYTVFDLIEMGHDPLAYRYMVLSSHYRKGMAFSIDSLKASEVALHKIQGFAIGDRGNIIEEYKNQFETKLSDDLAMPEVLALVWKMIKDEKFSEVDRRATLIDWDRVLGLSFGIEKVEKTAPGEVTKLADDRLKAKNDKNWAEADRLRGEIEKLGYIVEDKVGGYNLKQL